MGERSFPIGGGRNDPHHEQGGLLRPAVRLGVLMDAQVITAIFTTLGVIAAAAIAIIPNRTGWRSTVKEDIDIFYKMIPLTDNLNDRFILERYRRFIFSRISEEIGPSKSRSPVRTFVTLAIVFFIGMVVTYLLGIPLTPYAIIAMIISMAVGWLVGEGLCRLLCRFPKTDRNPLYRMTKETEELRAQCEQADEELEELWKESGMVSNYTAYIGWRRERWGAYLYNKRVRKDGDTKDGDDGSDERVAADEANDEPSQ